MGGIFVRARMIHIGTYHFLLQVRILDLYFVEGYKVFYRVGFALLRYFVKYIKKSNGIISSRGIKGAFMYFCKEITVRIII